MEIVKTADGSDTLYSRSLDESYHSTYGAVTESMHVFIDAGFNILKEDYLTIFEVGFGTGLNALLTLIESQKTNRKVKYYTLELYPLEMDVILNLNYTSMVSLDEDNEAHYYLMHRCKWGKDVAITNSFCLHKIKGNLETIKIPKNIHLVYFDAFSPEKQPEMWTLPIFNKIYEKMKPSAVLTTYCAKGNVKRILKSVGFRIENLPGPPGKREMIRAIK